jgi:hypothetical protein
MRILTDDSAFQLCNRDAAYLTVNTERPPHSPASSKRVLLFGLALLILAGLGGAGYWGLHQRYVPPEAIALAERFLSLIKAGNLTEAYSLTTQDAMSGRTLEQFQSNVRQRVAVDSLVRKQTIEWRGATGGFQSYGNRLRRWLAGRKIDPDIIRLEFDAGSPVDVRLVSSPEGKWRISYFQSRAE